MSEKLSQGNQAVQTFLIVIISVLLTAVVVLFLKKQSNKDENAQTTESADLSGVESNKDLLAQIVANANKVTSSLDTRELDLANALEQQKQSDAARKQLTNDIVKYKNEINQLRATAAQAESALTQLKSMQAEIEGVKKLNQTLMAENQNLKADNSSALLSTENTKLKLDKADLKLRIEGLVAELKEAKAKLTQSTDADAELISLRTTNKELQEEIFELRIRLNRSLLFVKEATQLNPRAAALFAALKKMDGQTGVELNAGYIALEATLNVKKIRNVKFAEGSALINELENGQIANDMRGAGDKSFFLVVGYASTTGSSDANFELSAKRATAVASSVLSNKTEGQNVKAVFLGQTQRFSATEAAENQVCEIWEIK